MVTHKQDSKTPFLQGAEPFEMGEGEHAILFVHGWTSTPRELRFLAETLQDHYFCKGILLKGHGTEVRDLKKYHWRDHLTQVQETFSDLSIRYKTVSLIGLSYGGTLALHTAVRRKVHRLVLLAPFLQNTGRALRWIPNSSLVPYLPKILPSIRKKSSPILEPKAAAEHIAYASMPLQPLKSVIQCTQEIRSYLPKVHCPTLIIHSTKDTTSDFNSSVDILKNIKSPSKSLIALGRSNHIITLDYEREQVERSVQQWLQGEQ